MSCLTIITDKGVVSSFGVLPLTGNALGDYYMVADTGIQYAWQSASDSGLSSNWESINAAAGSTAVDDSRNFQMGLQGRLNPIPVPYTDIGSVIVDKADTMLNLRAIRRVPGSAGTTTIQLELNGSAIVGATLSWTSADGSFSLKSTAITVAVVSGDRLSFRLTSKETGGEDIFVEVD